MISMATRIEATTLVAPVASKFPISISNPNIMGFPQKNPQLFLIKLNKIPTRRICKKGIWQGESTNNCPR